MSHSNSPADHESAEDTEEKPELLLRFWKILTNILSNTIAGIIFAIPGLLIAKLASIALPDYWHAQYMGYYLIGAMTLVALVLLDDLGEARNEEPDPDISNLNRGQLAKLIIALLTTTSTVVSTRLLFATVGAIVVTNAIGASAGGLWAVWTAIILTALDYEIGEMEVRLSIGGLAGLAILQVISISVGLARKERQDIQNYSRKIGTAR